MMTSYKLIVWCFIFTFYIYKKNYKNSKICKKKFKKTENLRKF